MSLFDPSIYVPVPGGGGGHLVRAGLSACPCGNETFEVVREPSGHISCQCPHCVKRNGVVVGAISMITGKGNVVKG